MRGQTRRPPRHRCTHAHPRITFTVPCPTIRRAQPAAVSGATPRIAPAEHTHTHTHTHTHARTLMPIRGYTQGLRLRQTSAFSLKQPSAMHKRVYTFLNTFLHTCICTDRDGYIWAQADLSIDSLEELFSLTAPALPPPVCRQFP